MKTIFFILLFLITFSFSKPLEQVQLKLNWKYQFQFAGFIMAKEKGFYEDLGLDVKILEKEVQEDFIKGMIDKKYDYVLSGSRVFFHEDLKKVKILANYFKQSPFAFVAKKDILSFASLRNKKIMTTKNAIEMDSIALLFDKYKMDKDDIKMVPLSYEPKDYLNESMDAMGLFTTDQLYYLDKKGISYNLFSPSNYGLNTPEMNLLTTNENYKNKKDVTLKIIQASNKGWLYALENKEETVQIIYNKYSKRKTLDALRYEAQKVEDIFLKDLFAIGELDMEHYQGYFHYLHDKKNINIDFTKLIHKTNNLQLTQSENTWKNKQKYLYLMVEDNLEPFVFFNEKTQKYEGLIIDFAKELSKKLNLELRCISKNDAKNIIKIDFIKLPIYEITNKENKQSSLLKNEVFVDNIYLKSYFDDKNIKVSFDNKKTILHIKNSQNSFFVANEITAKYWLKTLGEDNFKVIKENDDKISYSIKFFVEDSVNAYSTLKKAIKMIPLEKRRELFLKWTLYDENKFDYTLLYKTAFFVILLILVILYFNMKLNKKVQERTFELKELLKDFESLNKNLELKVEERTKGLEKLKNEKEKLLEKKIDSLKYASLLQSSIISENKHLKTFFTDSFIIWEPTDIVGGDIYFIETLNENEILIFVIDCTGHGVHGALLVMLVKAIQKQVIDEYKNNKKEVYPANILSQLNLLFVELIGSRQKNLDIGFDGGVFYLNKKENICRYSGARTPLYIVSNDKLNVFSSDKKSISNKNSKDLTFSEYEFYLKDKASFYMTTDGFIDQNGGQKGFPYGKKAFKNLLQKNHKHKFIEQRKIFLDEINNYSNTKNKNDDICFLGFYIDLRKESHEF